MTYRIDSRSAALIAVAVVAAVSGCGIPGNYAGGPLASEDRYCYESTLDYPQTLTLVDVRTGEQLWSVDVPVGQQCIVRFYEESNEKNKDRPDLMRWQLTKAGKTFSDLDNAMPVPSAIFRRMDVSYRENEAAKATQATN